jgi:signal transduction histidine kinase
VKAALPRFSLTKGLSGAQETVFSTFLLALAFLFRQHPSIVYPQLLYAFLGFLGFNLLYHRLLKGKDAAGWPAYAAVAVNGLLITSAIEYSGGPSSYMWVMFLLPLFTACLSFGVAGIAGSAAYLIALQTAVYAFGEGRLGPEDWLQLSSRVGLLLLSVFVTAPLALSERKASEDARRERERWDQSLRGARDASPEGGHSFPSLLSKGLHDVNGALSVIMGSVQIILMQASGDWTGTADARRVESAVRVCKQIAQNLALLGRREWAVGVFSVRALAEESLDQMKSVFGEKALESLCRFGAEADRVKLNPTLMKQALMNLLRFAADGAPMGATVRLMTLRRTDETDGVARLDVLVDAPSAPGATAPDDAFDPYASIPGRSRGAALGAYLAREIARRHGGEILLLGGGDVLQWRLTLPLAASGERDGRTETWDFQLEPAAPGK